jgi:CHRD domain
MRIGAFPSRLLLPVIAAAAAVALLWATASPAAARESGRKLSTVLTGAAEVGGGDPDGTGTATLRVNPGTGLICYTITVANLDPVTAAHIHNAPVGVNGPIVVPLTPPTSGSVTDCTTADPALARDIVRNPENYYVNVHTTVFPAGAVRGQL